MQVFFYVFNMGEKKNNNYITSHIVSNVEASGYGPRMHANALVAHSKQIQVTNVL